MKNVKKLFFVLLISLLVVSPLTIVNAKSSKKETTTEATTTQVQGDEKAVTVTVFYRSTCPHCKELHEFLNELKESDSINYKFNIVDYEVTDEANAAIMEKVGDYFDFSVDGVPFYVIGEKYYSGYSASMRSDLQNRIETLYDDQEQNIDVVAGIIDGSITGKLTDKNKQANNVVGYIILGVSVVIVVALIVSSSKNKYYDEEDEVEEETKKDTKKDKKN